ncbi:MAG: hypothetical protein R3E96_05085 [Planctomycetota bacterium]
MKRPILLCALAFAACQTPGTSRNRCNCPPCRMVSRTETQAEAAAVASFHEAFGDAQLES